MNPRLVRFLREMREQLKWYANQRVASAIRFALTTANSADGYSDAVEGNLTADESNIQDYQYTVRRLWPFGIRSRPPAGVDAVVVHAFGGSTNGVMVGAESASYGPDDLEEGETAIYSHASGAIIKIDKDGAIEVTSSSGQAITITAGAGANVEIDAGAAGNVVVNGGANNVARASVDTAGPYPISGGALFFKA